MRVLPYDPDFVARVRGGGPDAYGRAAESATSGGAGHPCRCCLRNIDEGEAMLVLSARPFPTPQPYAETGPIFLHAHACVPWQGPGIPPVLTTSVQYLVKAYGATDRILSGSGAVVAAADLADAVNDRLGREGVAFVDVRSAVNNCFLARAVAD